MARAYGVRPPQLLSGDANALALDLAIYCEAVKLKRAALRRAIPSQTRTTAQAVHNILSYLQINGG